MISEAILYDLKELEELNHSNESSYNYIVCNEKIYFISQKQITNSKILEI